jgi:hypothetical protein
MMTQTKLLGPYHCFKNLTSLEKNIHHQHNVGGNHDTCWIPCDFKVWLGNCMQREPGYYCVYWFLNLPPKFQWQKHTVEQNIHENGS